MNFSNCRNRLRTPCCILLYTVHVTFLKVPKFAVGSIITTIFIAVMMLAALINKTLEGTTLVIRVIRTHQQKKERQDLVLLQCIENNFNQILN